MKIGVPTEIKNHEYRVGLVPSSARELVTRGHRVAVQQGAGLGIGITDDDYRQVGAEIVDNPRDIFESAELIIKVKEPQPSELKLLRENQVLFTFLHLAPDPDQTLALKKSGAIAIAYETVTNQLGRLPLLTPMSEVAGRISIQTGAHLLEKHNGGKGILLGGVPGVSQGEVIIIGGGVVGHNALEMAIGLGARVTVIDRSLETLRRLDHQYAGRIQTKYSSITSIEKALKKADLVIGAALIPGAQAPKLVSREQLSLMSPGTVMVDVAIDQGGCFETSRPTTFSEPTYEVDKITHCCVANLPGAAARTSTFSLNHATFPYTLQLAEKGYKQALLDNPHFANGLNVHKGHITHQTVAESLGMDYVPVSEVL